MSTTTHLDGLNNIVTFDKDADGSFENGVGANNDVNIDNDLNIDDNADINSDVDVDNDVDTDVYIDGVGAEDSSHLAFSLSLPALNR